MSRSARLCVAALAVLVPSSSATAIDWQTLEPGLARASFARGEGQAFRVDLRRWRLTVAESGPRGERIGALARGTGASLAINGGFFTPSFAPLGLLLSRGRRLNRLRRADWGVLTISRRGRAHIVHTRGYRRRKGADFAIQAGPRLVTDGKLLKLKAQRARRTAIGIAPGGRELVLVVVDRPMLTSDLAAHMRDTFGCPFALNLDGGSSTQLWSAVRGVRAVSGFPVANGVLVSRR